MTISSVCADASLLIKLGISEADSANVAALVRSWLDEEREIVAPRLIIYEFVSAVRQAVRRGKVSMKVADDCLDTLLRLPITLIDSDDLHRNAYGMATELEIASAYDAHYLALATAMDCEFWTADLRLYSLVADRFPLIRIVGA